jgi:hypothetical protein
LFLIRDGDSTDLYCTDFIRNDNAYPSANILFPLSDSTIIGEIAIVGTVTDNLRAADDSVLSSLVDYNVKYMLDVGAGIWKDEYISYSKDCSQGDCQIENDTLGIWNTSFLESGRYTLSLSATDGQDSNVVYRKSYISHNKYIVDKEGGGDFTSISNALSTAIEGDTIIVNTGDYYENIAMKAGLKLLADGDSVRIFVSDGIGIDISNHEYPCEIKGITICNDPYVYGGRGIYISNSSPKITDCTIEHCGHDLYDWGAVSISGDSYPEFWNCDFYENKGSMGSALYINAGADEKPAPAFYNCRFFNNAEGSMIFLQYDHTTPLDSTCHQPLFQDCILRDNISSTDNPLIEIVDCHRPRFNYCELSNNKANYSHDGLIYGHYSGVTFNNCTVTGNEVPSSYDPLLNFTMLSQLGEDPVKVEKSIFSFNSHEVLDTGDAFNVNHSCLYENSPEDTLWLSKGEGNISENPAFCDMEERVLSLYNFSPCASIEGQSGFMGAYNMGCIPCCDSIAAQENYLIVCPAGDMITNIDSLLVHVDLLDSDMTRDIDQTELWMMEPSVDSLSFFIDGMYLYADSAATSDNGWHTTFTRKYIGGHFGDSLIIGLKDEILGKVPVTIKSPDYTGDGYVNMSDFGYFGDTFQECEGSELYNEWFDFFPDSGNCVTMSEYGLFGDHLGHAYNDSLGTPLLAEASINSNMSAEIEVIDNIEGDGVIEAVIKLNNAYDFSAFYMILQIKGYSLINWYPEEIVNKTAACQVERNGNPCVFLGAFNSSAGTESYTLGTLTLRCQEERMEMILAQYSEENDLGISLRIGEMLTKNGDTARLQNISINPAGENIVYRDKLWENYPNPFNPITTIKFSISKDSNVNLSIYNVKGQLVKTLVDGFRKKKIYIIEWDGKNNKGNGVSSGVYFYRLRTNYFTKSKKMVILR